MKTSNTMKNFFLYLVIRFFFIKKHVFFSKKHEKWRKMTFFGVQKGVEKPENLVDIGLLPSVVKNGFWGENNALIRFMQKMAKREIPPFPQVQTENRKKTPKKRGFSAFFGHFCPFFAFSRKFQKKPKKTENFLRFIG